MNRRVIALAISVIALQLLACSPASDSATGPPNIVLLIADDQSWADFGFMGAGRIETPNLDRLAREGVVFTHGMNTASACRPSLRSLLTGLDPLQFETIRAGVEEKGHRFAEIVAIKQLETLPRSLSRAGYVSFQGGKYWEGAYTDAGFSEGMTTGVSAEAIAEYGVMGSLSGGVGTTLGRTTMQPVLDFIDAHREEPFFVWFAPMLPHVPHDPEEEFQLPYAGPEFSGPERRYYGNITRLDARVGEILDRLEANGLRERTLVIFLADNGWDFGHSGEPATHGIGGPKGKLSIYENGFRTPIVFSWPGTLEPRAPEAHLVSSLDLYPTILDFAGVEGGATRRPGQSLEPLLMRREPWGRDHVIGGTARLRTEQQGFVAADQLARDEAAFFYRDAQWRYLLYEQDGREELYRIESDPWEKHNMVADRPELAARFRDAVERHVARMRARPDRPLGARSPVPRDEAR